MTARALLNPKAAESVSRAAMQRPAYLVAAACQGRHRRPALAACCAQISSPPIRSVLYRRPRRADAMTMKRTARQSQNAAADSGDNQQRFNGAAPTTVEALMVGFRSGGIAHLQQPNLRRRLMDCSPDQVREIIARLLYCRATYPGRDPGINDELLLTLRNLIAEQAR
jgi:hypothetical protein